ncbi:uncharacterized protein LOC110372765 [Helicoverpa armigera]|uniref:uncharacterized protein LOC110372765 n=1 Tax=Helicoverpa armigera TaxID=29058 RepID=UPI003083A3BC
MYSTFLLFTSFLICQISSEPIQKTILDYFNSESVRKFRNDWEIYRKPLEHAVTSALLENVGNPGMNVYIRRQNEDLALGLYHDDNQVQLVLLNILLQQLPSLYLPEVQFSLASNVLKIYAALSKIIIHADYAIARNKSDIIHEPIYQNPYEASPFRFQQVSDIGKITLILDSCVLNGFLITSLSGESVNLGYDHLRLLHCQHTIELYQPGDDSPPVITRYNPYRLDDGLKLTDLLMRPISEELVPKVQAAMFTFINTSSIFQKDLKDLRENQEVVFQATWLYVTEIVRNLNRITIERNGGAIDIKDKTFYWEDVRETSVNKSETLTILEVVLTGLDTLYCAHSGGPYRMKSAMIGEQIRFSTLQVRGHIDIGKDRFAFVIELKDLAVDVQLEVKPGQVQVDGEPYKILEIVGYRRMLFTAPSLMYPTVEALVSGYFLKELPKLIMSHLKSIFAEALGSAHNSLNGNKADACKEQRDKTCGGTYSYDCTNPHTNKMCKTTCTSTDCVCKPGFVSSEGKCIEDSKINTFDERARLRHLRQKMSKKHERINKIRK